MTIISAQFDNRSVAERALVALGRAGFNPADVRTFKVQPPAVRDADLPGDTASTSAVRGALYGSGTGFCLALVAMAAAPGTGTDMLATGVWLGAGVGGLIAAVARFSRGPRDALALEPAVRSEPWPAIVVSVDSAEAEQLAIRTLQTAGAKTVRQV